MKKPHKVLLAIESSCDDTGASVMIDANIASNVVSSQIDHAKWGGVIPELASRKHMEGMSRGVDQAILDAGIKKSSNEAISFTRWPGLEGGLLVGVFFAQGVVTRLQ